MSRLRAVTGRLAAVLAALCGVTGVASAHVDYVVNADGPGSAAALFRAVFTSPVDLAVLGVGG
jgi:hypothetical protein